MNYQSYKVEDFAQDKYFRKWVLDPDNETQQFWEGWVARHPDHANTISQARNLVLLLPEVRHIYNKDQEEQLWNKIVQEINFEVSPQISGKVIPLPNSDLHSDIHFKQRRIYITIAGLAASLLIIVGFIVAYLLISTKSDLSSDAQNWVVMENPYGQRSTIYLSDGTEVILNAGSRLRYPQKFSKENRRVQLRGEAFFQVAKDTTRPFEVMANHIATQALGTSFNIRAFPGELLQVSLVTGKVQVKHSQREDKVFLSPGECAIYDTANLALKKGTFDEKMILAWKNGIIYFKDADQQTVFKALEKWYGVKINTLNTSPKVWKYTGQLKNMSLDQFLETLQFSMDFKYHIKDKQVTIEYMK